MRIGTLLLELLIVLAIILCLYHVYFNKTKSSLYDDKGEIITKDVKSILNSVSSNSIDSSLDSNNDKREEIEKKVNKLIKKYNIM